MTIDFLSAIEDACAERIVQCRGGWAVLDSRHPRLWSANWLRGETGVTADPESLVEAAEEHFGALDFRLITTFDEAVGMALDQPLEAPGYESRHELIMVYCGSPTPAEPSAAITQVACERLAPSRVAAAAELLGDADVGVQLASRDELIASVVAVRCLAVLDQREIAARCQLYAASDVVQIENVYTAPRYRRRGFARALVERGVREAHACGARLVFLVADANDWPHHLYRDIGFRDAGLHYRFMRIAA